MTDRSRTVVILGCSRGIGLGLLEHFSTLKSSKSLIGVVRKESDADRLRLHFSGTPGITILCGDVTDRASMDRVVSEIRSSGFVPDLLICNAGILTFPKSISDISAKEMSESFSVNVLGPFNAMQAFLPLMRNVAGAVIVNMSSGFGLWGEQGQSTYCMSKHALEGLVKCVAQDVAGDAVSVVTVRPGMVYTDMLETAYYGDGQLAKQKGVPVKRFAPHFIDKVMAITKADSGTHIDCGYKGPRDW